MDVIREEFKYTRPKSNYPDGAHSIGIRGVPRLLWLHRGVLLADCVCWCATVYNLTGHTVHVHRETREYNYTLGYEIVSEGRPLKTLNGHGSFMEEDSFGSWAHAGDVFVIKSYAAGFDEKYMVGHDGKQFLFITDSVLISDTRTAV
jgi:hypothetical protein